MHSLVERLLDGEQAREGVVGTSRARPPRSPGRPSRARSATTSDYNRFGDRSNLALTQGAEALTHTWGFDARGRLEAASLPGSAPLFFTPFEDDTLETIEYASGAASDFAYYPQGPVESITLRAEGTTQQNRLAYGVNAVHSLTALSEQHASADPVQAYGFGYDEANRLTAANYPAAYGFTGNDAFDYDLAGNREDPDTASLYDYDAGNRITASPGIGGYTHDADGNLTARTAESFGYDFANRLKSFTNTLLSAGYAYDPFGRRIKKSVNGVTTWYLWDGDQLLAEYDGAGARTTRYAYAGGFAPVQVAYPDGPGSEAVYDVHSDHLDTPRLLTDAASTVVWREAHEAFGKAYPDDDPDGDLTEIRFNVRFPGQYFDEESGLHYNRFRTYDPVTGRYLEADPIVTAPSGNVFLYALANPLRWIDALGLSACDAFVNGLVAQ